MSDTTLEVKAPWDAIDILPQERITGDILRGRGPRRGNLERLLKYWRPIMRKPGGFRRCIIILANHACISNFIFKITLIGHLKFFKHF